MNSFEKNLYHNPNNVAVGNGFYSKPKNSHSSPHKNLKKKILTGIVIVFGFFFVVGGFWFTKNVLQGLPDVSKIKDMVFSQATVITDRNGEELYKLFEENRQYVDYSGINKNMINAIIAIEDQRYREHNGLDPMGIIRAGLNNMFNPGSRLQGASTIPQQLVRNLLLSRDRKYSRKFKEILLTSRLSSVLEDQIHKEKGNLSSAELRTAMKDMTLELYLNYIFFGNNAYGVEAASKAYFAKSAIDIDILESSILASIPKGPSIYNPYKNPDKVVGEFIIKDNYGNPVAFTGDVRGAVISKVKTVLQSSDLSDKKKNNSFINYLKGITKFSISASGMNLNVEYVNGRKDLVLTRMYEDSYITEQQLKDAFIEGIDYEFRQNTFPIVAPHFVQWIIEEVEKRIDKETLAKGGFIIQTTLDLAQQKIAEDAITSNVSVLQQNGANNAAMIYLDSLNGDVLAYVGSINYFDDQIQGQNDMIRRPRQTGSSVKPLVYSIGLENLPITIDTPIFDIPTKIGQDQPNNADDKFEGLLPLKLALGHSRNIPAVKMAIAVGGEEVIKPYFQKLGILSIKDNIEYGYTIALGAGEMLALELANSYMHLSAQGKPAVIDPILEIRSRDGSLIYQKTVQQQEEVVNPGVAYLMWKILSDTANRIPGWGTKFNVPGLTYALKSGTSNAKTSRGNRPRDGVLVAYTPSKVALFRAGNADGTPMNANAYGGNIHASPVKQFLAGLVKNNFITNETMKATETTNVQISKISGKAASSSTPGDLVVDTMMYTKAPGLDSDGGASSIQYDLLCGGAPGSMTPPQNIKNGYLISPVSFMPNGFDIKDITDWFNAGNSSMLSGESLEGGGYISGKVTYNYPNIFVQTPTESCEGVEKISEEIKVQIAKPTDGSTVGTTFSLGFGIQSPKNIRKVSVSIDNTYITSFSYEGQTKTVTDIKDITIGTGIKDGSHKLTIVAFDFAGFTNKAEVTIKLDKKVEAPKEEEEEIKDTEAPTLLEDQISIEKLEGGKYNVTLKFSDDSETISKGKITNNGNIIKEFTTNSVSFMLDSLVPVSIEVSDASSNKLNKSIDLSTYFQE